MKTHVECDPREGVYKVWCWAPRGNENVMLAYTDGILVEGETISAGIGASLRDTKPTLVADYEIVEALIDAYNPGLHPGNALSSHLADAIKVRDRLLQMIESTFPGRGA